MEGPARRAGGDLMGIEIRGVSKRFGRDAAGRSIDRANAVKDVSLTVHAGELVALLGPSGAGKTTLLRIIAGLERADAGSIHFFGEDATARSVRERGVGFVFQHYALFRHLTIFENVAFGLRVRPRAARPPEKEIKERVMKLLDLVQLAALAQRRPSQLSGGQRQRVALARALAVEPKVLLLDEPFGSLDARVRHELRRWLRRLHDELHVTSVLVTHDQDEALEVADRVVVMNEGRIEQVGTPEEIYHEPATPFVCRFLGRVNRFSGRVHQGLLRVGGMEVRAPQHLDANEIRAAVYARPHEIEILPGPEGAAASGVLLRANAAGPVVRLELRRPEDGELIVVECTSERRAELPLKVGEPVYLGLRRHRFFLDDPN